MSTELEVLGAASVGGASRGPKADLAGQPCQNCGATVTERYCPNCGQLAASFHRPFWSLTGEVISDTLSLDGRIARTLPKLLFRPGMLTRAYTSGKRARYVPPFRLFLLASVVFYLTLFATIKSAGWLDDIQLGDPETGEVSVYIDEDAQSEVLVDANGNVDREVARRLAAEGGETDPRADYVIDGVSTVMENPDAFRAEVETWTPRLSFLFVPVTILALSILHFWRRSIYVYDHAIHALHLHSWIYVVGAITMITGQFYGAWVAAVFAPALFLYVWRSLAVATSSGAIMSLIRMMILFYIWVVTTVLLVVAAVIVSGLSVQA